MAMRGTKFNIPLDIRTPSYTDVCDASQLKIPEMWSFEFWKEHIDTLAHYHYKFVSLWNLHPFPSLVKAPKYPDVALTDVWRSKVAWKEDYPPEGHEFVEDLGDMKTIWTLRNDDVYYSRWGAPDFVRQFVKNIPHDVSQGYYFGSDQYIWGREFLQRDGRQPRQLEVDRHWYQWLLWGRLAYNPDVDNQRLKAIIADRLSISATDADRLFEARQNASMIYPETTGFHWGALDFQWYIEGCESHASFAQNETGFHDVNRFINLKPHTKNNCLSIPEFAKAPGKADPSGRRTPLQVADQLDQHSQRALDVLEALQPTGGKELRQTLADIRIVANLGRTQESSHHAERDVADV